MDPPVPEPEPVPVPEPVDEDVGVELGEGRSVANGGRSALGAMVEADVEAVLRGALASAEEARAGLVDEAVGVADGALPEVVAVEAEVEVDAPGAFTPNEPLMRIHRLGTREAVESNPAEDAVSAVSMDALVPAVSARPGNRRSVDRPAGAPARGRRGTGCVPTEGTLLAASSPESVWNSSSRYEKDPLGSSP